MFTTSKRGHLGLPIVLVLVCMASSDRMAVNADDPAKEVADQKTLLETFRKEFLAITPGKNKFPDEFKFGPPDDPSAVTVKLTESFEISKYETYQSVFQSVMERNPSRWKGPRNPVDSVSWDECLEFCRKATQLMRDAKLIEPTQVVRLPTEVEWEYCAKAGTSTVYSFGNDPRSADDVDSKASVLNDYGWYSWNSKGKNPAVGVLKPNPWGLFDVHGYVWELCLDEYSETLASVAKEPHVPFRKSDRPVLAAMRGGSWGDEYTMLRTTARTSSLAFEGKDYVGFRCVLSPEKKQ